MDPSFRWGDGWRQRRLASGGGPQQYRRMAGGYVYIMANRRNGALYVGVTAHIAARAMQHRSRAGSDFCRRYKIERLVYIERHERIEGAIAREKMLKAWKRAWKIELIEQANPDWDDLYLTLNA